MQIFYPGTRPVFPVLKNLLLLILVTVFSQYLPAQPHIRYFTPKTAKTWDTVLVVGNQLTGTTAVSFGGVKARSFYVWSDTAVYAIVGTGASGYVAVTTPSGMDSLAGFTFSQTVVNPPLISSFSPGSAAQGTKVTIHGKYFTGTVTVTFGGTSAQSFTVTNDSTISAIVGSGSSGSITVRRTDGAISSITGFIFIGPPPPPPPPHITSFKPDSARTNDTVIIRGRNFTGINQVRFGGIAAHSWSVFNDSTISATVGTGASGAVAVAGPNGMDSLWGFTFISASHPVAPHISSFTPDSATQGASVKIYGQHFTGVTAVRFGGIAAQSFNVTNDSTITAYVGSGASGYVWVQNPAGQDSLRGFIFINPPRLPHILSFAPDSARYRDTVTIRGTNLTGVNSVSFGDIAAQSFTVISDSTIIAIVGTGASGYVVVTKPNGYLDSLRGFIFINANPPAAPENLKLHPNPAINVLTVAVPVTTSPSKFELADLSGRVIRSMPVSPGVSQVDINVAGIRKGIYKLIWRNGSEASFRTVLIMP